MKKQFGKNRRDPKPGGRVRRKMGDENLPQKNASPTDWDQAAKWYDALVGQEGSGYQTAVVFPRAWEMINIKKPGAILDLACGQGAFSRFLKDKGLEVTGLDASSELLLRARKRTRSGIRYLAGNAKDQSVLTSQEFDRVVCLLAIQNMDDIEAVFSNVSRWMKPGGRFIFVMTHPCFRIPRQSHWHYDESKKMMSRRMDAYLAEKEIPIVTPPFKSSDEFTLTYHRPLENYFKALNQAGLSVELLEEWPSHKVSQPGPRSKAENRARDEIPLFLAMSCVHLNPTSCP